MMTIRIIRFSSGAFAVIAAIIMLSSKGVLFPNVFLGNTEELAFTLSSSYVMGYLIYGLTSGLPMLIKRKERRDAFKDVFSNYLKNSIRRLQESAVTEGPGNEILKDRDGLYDHCARNIAYGDRRHGAKNTVYDNLALIKKDTIRLNYELGLRFEFLSGEKMFSLASQLIHHQLLSEKRKYLYVPKGEIEVENVMVGRLIADFYLILLEARECLDNQN